MCKQPSKDWILGFIMRTLLLERLGKSVANMYNTVHFRCLELRISLNSK